MNTFFKQFFQSSQFEYLKNIFTLASGSAFSQLILIVLTPVLSRLFSPDDFGLYALFLLIISILGVLATGRYEVAILLPRKEKDAQSLFQLSTSLGLFFSILTALVLYLCWPLLVTYFDSSYQWIYYWIPIGLALQVLLQTATLYANRKKEYQNLAMSRVAGSSATSVGSIGFGIFKLQKLGLIYGKLIGLLLEVVYLYTKIWKRIQWNPSSWRAVAKKYRNFPKYSTFEALLNMGHKQLPILVLTSFFSLGAAGLYALANTLLTKPLGTIATSFAQVFYQKTAEEEHLEGDELRLFFLKNLRVLFLLAIFPSLLVLFFGPFLFAFFLGEEWYEAGVYASWLIPFLFFNFLKTAFSSLVDTKNKIRENALWEFVFLGTGILAFYFAWRVEDALLGIKLYSMLGMLLAVGQLYWYYQLTKSNKQWDIQRKDI